MMDLSNKRLILVVGKGGVGRSTVAAAAAGQLARQGKRVLLYETSANDRFGAYFGKPPVGPEPVELAPNLWAVNATPASALAEYGLMILRFKTVYEMVFENRVTKAFLRAIPGLDDYALLGKAWFHSTEEKRGKLAWDTIVFDMPASGHAYSMLRVPYVITETVPEGPLTRDARTIKQLLTDPVRTSTLLVTLAEEMPVNEAIELEQKLTDLGIVPQHLIANQMYPEHFPEGQPISRVLDSLVADRATLTTPLAEVTEHSRMSRDRFRLNNRYLAEMRARAKTPVTELPMLFSDKLTPNDIVALGAWMTAG